MHNSVKSVLKKPPIHIIGGGVIGLSSAWYLRQAGHEVVVIDRSDLSDGTSHGNAGMIVPSHFVPLAAPGVIAQGIRWMFDAKSPFFIKPRLSWELLQWLGQFYRACSRDKVERAAPVLKAYNELSKDLYRQFSQIEGFNFNFEEKGLLMLYREAATEREEREMAEKAHELGMAAEVLTGEALAKLEPNIRLSVRGGVYYPGDAHLYPNRFLAQLIQRLQADGVQFLTGRTVTDWRTERGRISALLLSDGTSLPIDRVVLAAGSWSGRLAKKLGLRLLLQDGRGYSITLPEPTIAPSIPTILTEARVAVTPMGGDLRIGGTLEISNFATHVNPRRLSGILESLPRYYPDLQPAMPSPKDVWIGYRPCSPDGLPYLGASRRFPNLTLATGHAMMGMSLGPATGWLVAEIIGGKTPSIDTSLFEPERF